MGMRFATSFVTVCFLACALESSATPVDAVATASPAPVSSLATFLAKARLASGAPYRFHVVSHSREVQNGTTFEVSTEFEGLKYLARSCDKALCTGFYFDGEHSFNTNFNDTALPISGGVDGLQITLRAISSYAFTDPDFAKNGGTLIERDPLLRDGKKFRRISVAPRLGALLDAVLDPATGLVAGVISDERKYAFEFSDQRQIGNGVTLPFSISLNGYTFTKFDGRSILSTPLQAPVGVAPTFATRDARVAMQHGVAPVVPCTIGGTPATCALDSGDSGLSMSLELAKKLGIAPLGGKYDEHGAGQYISGIAKAPTLSVGSATYPSADYVVLHDLQQNGYDAILGADAFAHARITLDFANRAVEFAAPVASATGGVPIGFYNFVPVATAEIDGRAVSVAVDSGAQNTIGLSSDFADRHPEFTKGSGAAVRLGSFTIANQTLDAPQKMPYDGRIGSAFLAHFAVTFDYARSAVTFVPNPGDSSVRRP